MKKPQIIFMIVLFAVVMTGAIFLFVYFKNTDDNKISSMPAQSSSEESDSTMNNSKTVSTVSVVSNVIVSTPSTVSKTSIPSSAAASSKVSAKTSVPVSPAISSELTVSVKTSTPISSAVSVAPASSSASDAASFITEVVRLINIERAKEGLGALTESSALNTAANIRASEIITSFTHLRPNGKTWDTVLSENGITYTAAGENLAAGQKTPADAVAAWMGSAAHKGNVMNPSYNKIGVGYLTGGEYGYYWSQIFTN